MAKGKGKRSSDANESHSEAAVAAPGSQTTPDVPNLDEGAFAGLRQKIEQRLKDQKSGKGKSKDNGKAKAPAVEAPLKKEKQKADQNQGSAKGKKRDRNGEVIAREEKKGGKNKKEKSDAPAKNNQEDTLRQEILALGGTEEDFELLAGVDSESEVEDAPSKSKNKSGEDSLRNELSKMLEAAGQVVPPDLADEEVDEGGEDEEEDEGEDEDGDDSSEPEDSDVDETPTEPAAPEVKVPKEYAKLAVLPRSDWYAVPPPPIAYTKQMNDLPRHLIDRIHELANTLLQEENDLYAEAQKTSASSSHKFYSTIMSSGTLSDKISALTLAVQESPLHNTKALETLITLGGKRSRAQAVEVLRSLKDMFAQGTLLPSDRRLRSFANQPSLVAAFQGAGGRWGKRDPLPGGLQKSHLIVWAYEHMLKEQFFEILKILETWCNDEIEFSRSRAVSYVYELLKEKPEQESNLLRLLVNKLGDPSKKIGSRASYLLLQLEQAHPLMKPTIISAVEEVLFRPGQSQHAKYYAIITLNQTVLSLKEEEVAAKLLNIYFSLFVALLKPTQPHKPAPKGKPGHKGPKGKRQNQPAKGEAQDDEMREKLVSGVLTGVNRAYPFTNSDSESMSKHLETLFRITHSSNFNTSIQALMLIQQLTASHKVGGDRFYRTLYESLLDPRVATSSKQSLYLNLLFKALKNDVNVRRVKAFVKRLVQVLGLHQPAFVCGVFYLIRELEKTFNGLQSLVDQPEDNESDGEEVFRDMPDEDDEQPAPIVETKSKPTNGYDPRKRDPEHSNADKTCLWELLPYTSHFHPSVSVNAAHLLEHQPMSGKPDLTIHTLTHFLDRFVYRTPKATTSARGTSIMQPLAGGDAADRLVEAFKSSQKSLPLNTEAFWKKKADDVAAEDVFFHEYFSRVNKDKDKARSKKGKGTTDPVDRDEEDAEGLSDNESEIWKALVDSRPELEADDDSDEDLDMDDLESAFDEDEDAEEGEDDGGVIFNDESDEASADEDMDEVSDFEGVSPPPPAASKASKKTAKKDEEEEDEDDFDMDVSDDEAFIDSDEDLPSDMELGGVEVPDDKASERKKRRKLKHLPTFASAEDYAALLDAEDDGIASISSTLLRRELSSASGSVRPIAPRVPAAKNSLVYVAAPKRTAQTVRYASNSSEPLRKTQLYDLHVAHGAKMVPFAGFDMPLQYADLSHVESHMWTREKASLFDVSHMVQHHLSGPGALDLLMKVTPSSLDKLSPNTSTLSCLLEEGTGGIVDDTVITRRGEDSFYFVTNAGRRTEDLAFLQTAIDAHRAENGADSIKWDILEDRALVALQGPLAASILQRHIYTAGDASAAEADLSTLYFGQCRELHLTLPDGSATAHPLLISRTGYTGEDGFEISIPSSGAPSLPQQVTELLLSDKDHVRLAGLAARDSLRLEAGMCLYGHDISTAQTPPAAALGWVVGRDRRDAATATFNGASVILPQIASPKSLAQRRVGLNIEKGPPAREGAAVVDLADPSNPVEVGVVTSGLPSPSLGGANIAMAYVKNGLHKKGTELGVKVRNKVRKASVTGMPWVESKFHRPQ
ncbi:hypothetical protein N7474_000606 [Penicillium riverlandense]|uniref:uncharacterized protein n=1 Tax=Penicillium riverlandense TaxID=1903569 RepID=UPI0025495D7B|nr:uncharacterized protein N7474_000606 [Penicillium riverlandense]KAJ5832295.1 hypothetical protein N7474_000606 [Penicillium riverlandense]